MARNYKRDRNGRFSRTGGGSARSRALSASNRKRATAAANAKVAANKSRNRKVRGAIAVAGLVGVGIAVAANRSKPAGAGTRIPSVGAGAPKTVVRGIPKPGQSIKNAKALANMDSVLGEMESAMGKIMREGGFGKTPSSISAKAKSMNVGGGKTKGQKLATYHAINNGRNLYNKKLSNASAGAKLARAASLSNGRRMLDAQTRATARREAAWQRSTDRRMGRR